MSLGPCCEGMQELAGGKNSCSSWAAAEQHTRKLQTQQDDALAFGLKCVSSIPCRSSGLMFLCAAESQHLTVCSCGCIFTGPCSSAAHRVVPLHA